MGKLDGEVAVITGAWRRRGAGEVCAFPASDEASFVTGQAICPDGGAAMGYRR